MTGGQNPFSKHKDGQLVCVLSFRLLQMFNDCNHEIGRRTPISTHPSSRLLKHGQPCFCSCPVPGCSIKFHTSFQMCLGHVLLGGSPGGCQAAERAWRGHSGSCGVLLWCSHLDAIDAAWHWLEREDTTETMQHVFVEVLPTGQRFHLARRFQRVPTVVELWFGGPAFRSHLPTILFIWPT